MCCDKCTKCFKSPEDKVLESGIPPKDLFSGTAYVNYTQNGNIMTLLLLLSIFL